MTMQLHDKSILIQLHNDPGILSFILKLTNDDKTAFKKMLVWPRSLIGMLSKNDTNIVEFLNKCTQDELVHIQDMLMWPQPLYALLTKNNNKVLKFLNRITDTERLSLEQILDWSPTLLKTLRDLPEHIMVMYRMWDIVPDMTVFLKTYFSVFNHPRFNSKDMMDAFSNGQLNSKLWLIDTARSLNLSLDRVWTLCGWIGTLAYLLFLRRDELSITHIRSFDIDDNCHELADTMNRKYVVEGWDFKASTLDVNLLQYDDFTFNTIRRNGTVQPVFDSADTVINTSCDHMGASNQWWDSIPSGKLVILQNNDFFEHDEHSNCCFSLEQFKSKYPMQQILFEGALDCTIYNRFMLIGYK